jgi:hypothetical protein
MGRTAFIPLSGGLDHHRVFFLYSRFVAPNSSDAAIPGNTPTRTEFPPCCACGRRHSLYAPPICSSLTRKVGAG